MFVFILPRAWLASDWAEPPGPTLGPPTRGVGEGTVKTAHVDKLVLSILISFEV